MTSFNTMYEILNMNMHRSATRSNVYVRTYASLPSKDPAVKVKCLSLAGLA